MTTVAPPSPAPRSAPETAPGDGPARMIRVSANLLPDTVIAARRLSKLKRQLGLGLVGLLGLLVIGYGWSWWQTKSARDDLSAAQQHSAQMRSQMRDFAPLLTAQTRAQAITGNLRTVMVSDLQWRDLIASVRAKAGPGIHVTTVTGSVAPGSASNGVGLGVLNNTGQLAVGTLTVTGTATDSKSVAAFVDGLAVTKGLASPIPANVAGVKGSVAFTINLLLTSDALGGRFTPTSATGGH